MMNEKMRELCEIVGAEPEMMQYNRMTADEILECLHCIVDEDGEIIDMYSGKATGIWYDEIEH